MKIGPKFNYSRLERIEASLRSATLVRKETAPHIFFAKKSRNNLHPSPLLTPPRNAISLDSRATGINPQTLYGGPTLSLTLISHP